MAGILVSHLIQSYLFIIFSFLIILLILLVLFQIKDKKSFMLFGIALFYLIGGVSFLYNYNNNLNKYLEYDQEHVTIKGYIGSEPDIKESRVTYIINTEEIILRDERIQIKGKVRLSTLNDTELIQYGREVLVSGRLNIPTGRRNPGGFDFRNYLNQSKISATMFATEQNIDVKDGYKGNLAVKYGLALRERVLNVINKSLPPSQAALLNAILLGCKSDLGDEVEGMFRGAGLAHVIVVSGMHVGYILLGLVIFFRKCKVKRSFANIIIIIILWGYALMTGFGPSVIRAVIMASVVLIGQIIKREADVLNSIFFAALIMLLYNPAFLFSVGFQLSFIATISIVLFYKNIKELLDNEILPQYITGIISLTLAAQLGVIPVVAFYFNEISLVSVISNVLVAPVVGIITILGLVMAVLGQIHIFFSQAVGLCNNALLSFVLFVSSRISSLPFATVRVITPSILFIGAYYTCLFYFFWYKPKYKVQLMLKHRVIIGVSVFIVILINLFIPKGLEVVFLDVGQGDSAFIRTESGKTVLIDGGGYLDADDDSNIGDDVVIPFLLDYGVTKLDVVAVTHGHIDHTQGLEPVLESFDVSNFIIPDVPVMDGLEELLRIAKERDINIESCKKGDIIDLDRKTHFKVLHPKRDFYINESALNNNSLVLKLYYEDVSMLFTGDIEIEAERMLIDDEVFMESDVLKVAHHGSGSSTTPEFLERVNPLVAVISVGRNNFGHPSSDVLDLLKGQEVHVLRTDKDGAVIVKSDGEEIRVFNYR
ncbi:DNA internalization-related competence protein ComEC/Rec2 [Herbivorax sp. ANBcel31]|uniref:DNA internalization-related competence protein ComEC/Rec2 n=1 Tax=Herbivorax sp. ANBcel31 TaxID=3069754 RepID=UPI0027B6399F|nr:DNA internalization-related competence protein ComEC/Rec2 [Herbivorax sp. ANBcel31]MDQ2085939.1 DNA internalization-related competence protein ComEC/Rec2 [Herbivorax sp. ANBcel31]